MPKVWYGIIIPVRVAVLAQIISYPILQNNHWSDFQIRGHLPQLFFLDPKQPQNGTCPLVPTSIGRIGAAAHLTKIIEIYIFEVYFNFME